KLVEQGLVTPDPHLDRLQQLWRETGEAAKAIGRLSEAAQRTAKLVLDRVHAFYKAREQPKAKEMLEAAQAVLPHEDLENELALLTTDMAVQKANDGDLVGGTDMLREAYLLARHQPRIKKNLILVLRAQ